MKIEIARRLESNAEHYDCCSFVRRITHENQYRIKLCGNKHTVEQMKFNICLNIVSYFTVGHSEIRESKVET